MSVKILIDSASDISLAEAEKLGIYMIAMPITFSDAEYLDGVNLLPDLFYEKLVNSETLPKTSQINPYRFKEKFKELTSDGSEVICITMSSRLSGTYLNACNASKSFDGKVQVVDSLNACIGERMLCDYAIRLVKQGLNAIQIKEELDIQKKRINVFALIDTLEYLKKGGRVSSVAALAGKVLAVKPLIAVLNGEVEVVGKTIGTKKGNMLMTSHVKKSGGIDFDMPFCVAYSGFSNENIIKYVENTPELWETLTEEPRCIIVGSTIGTHIGPGAIGLSYFSKEEKAC